MDIRKFCKVAESLRQYRRAELKDFEKEVGERPVDKLYVDPLPSDAVLNTVMSSNTTFLLGRKGTGKSTVFAKAQLKVRELEENISIYIDVKTLYTIMREATPVAQNIDDMDITGEVYLSHMLRKSFLSAVLAELIQELENVCDEMSLWDRWLGRQRDVEEVLESLGNVRQRVLRGGLSSSEIPILQQISKRTQKHTQQTERAERGVSTGTSLSVQGPSLDARARASGFDEMLSENEIYESYCDAILLSFPYAEILDEIKDLLRELGMNRLIIFFDDFSEISWLDQRLFVDVILAPLNNSSDEKIKLKVAGYPGRVYYGSIDPGKVDTVSLDFYDLYKSQDIQSTESRAIDYTTRLLTRRFQAFDADIHDYFDLSTPLDEYMRLIFQTTFNVPRIMGYILYYCYIDRVSHGELITSPAIRLASQKYYEDVLSKYFERMNRFALEPFERKLDRHNQQELLEALISEAREVRLRIRTGEIRGSYFDGLGNPPASHFSVSPSLEKVLAPLELNFLVTKYHEMRDKDGNDVFIYALFYGLCESERMPWGYPRGRRKDRSYFVQRCFSYTRALHQFLSTRQTIRCDNCEAYYSVDEREKFEFFKWRCPECRDGRCSIVSLAEERLLSEIENLNIEIGLEPVELEILEVLFREDKPMRASEVSSLIDVTYQLVGKRTSKLQDLGLVEKNTDESHFVRSHITQRAKDLYFQD